MYYLSEFYNIQTVFSAFSVPLSVPKCQLCYLTHHRVLLCHTSQYPHLHIQMQVPVLMGGGWTSPMGLQTLTGL